MAFELLERTSLIWKCVLFILERRMDILKEALERIRLAEEENKQAEQAMIEELEQYQADKQKVLQTIQTEQKELRKSIIDRLEHELLEKENELQARLLAEAAESQKKDEEIYHQHKEKMITQIIDEMRENYGC